MPEQETTPFERRLGRLEPGIVPPGEEEERRWWFERAIRAEENLENPRCSPEVGRVLVDFELLRPVEQSGMNIEWYEAKPVLTALRKKADAGHEIEALRETPDLKRVEELRGKIAGLQTRLDASQDEEEKKSLGEEIKSLETERRKYEWLDSLVDKRGEIVKSGKKEKWEKVFDETQAAIALQRAWYQRTKLEDDVDSYAERLFFSSMEKQNLSPSKMVALLGIPEIGQAIEKALEIYIDIHLGYNPDAQKDKSLKIIQSEQAIKEERERCFAYVRQKCSDKTWVAERAELLARHLVTATLLSVWLGAGRDEKGNLKYEGKIPKPGIATLEGESQSDLIKLIFFRSKTISDLNSNRPAGPPTLAPGIPEYLSEDFFHFAKTQDTKESVFDAWYIARKERKDVRLADVLRRVNEGAFSYWAYCMFRQNRVKSALWEMEREKMVVPLFVSEALRALNKDFGVGFGDDVLTREITKINLVAARLITWSGGKNTDVADSRQEFPSVSTTKGVVKTACLTSGFLNEKEWELVEGVMSQRKALAPREILKTGDSNTLRALLRRGEAVRIEKISAKSLKAQLEEIKNSDRLVEEISRKVREGGGIDKINESQLGRIIMGARSAG